MYGIDKSVNFHFLVGKELVQICIGLYQLILNFSDQVSIAVECMIRLCRPDGSMLEISCDAPELTRALTCLLGYTVVSINTEFEGEMILKFSDGSKLFIVDSNEDQESFTITTPDLEVIV
jgi:hypothetical protein